MSTRQAAAKRAVQAAAASSPIVVDSSCWIEFFADSPRAGLFAPAIEQVHLLVVPVLTIYEVVKKLARENGEDVAAQALSLMQRGQVVAIDLHLALAASSTGLPMADSLIYATAKLHGAVLWTQDTHFEGLPGVKFFPRS